ncbi:alkaline phosphatase family protein [Pseudarthrobacter sp. BRE9]|uniref:alkaline phosphatase family protein n=1 Tax=Pseudarthrobacter sp. BRE9 TaxID=2962582 RepID=UPI0028826E22|nr:alkaline phosphatase family protein [Pseudarthrobacter sp. BRE9]MDT0168195.1 alkaline phosphatase family protein [Pseudarthrobacter sp. BRE9]
MEHRSAPRMKPHRWPAPALLLMAPLLVSALAGCEPATPAPAPPQTSSVQPQAPSRSGQPGHVFVINLENKGYDLVWGGSSPAPYLSGTLRSQGVLLQNYYGIGHNSLPNYLAQISGQPPNKSTRDDCHTYTAFRATGTGPDGTLHGNGCVYPKDTQTVAGQLTAQGKTWKGYMEDMQQPCEHPILGEADNDIRATANMMYATRHNPFVYFRSMTSSPDCAKNVVNFSKLAGDLKSVDTTPNLVYITPNLCHDGHDENCADGSPGGLEAVDAWLKDQVPAILSSPAYQQDGMLVITFDEADGGTAGPSEGDAGSPAGGAAGGRVGALVLSPFSAPGASSDQPYNHYSLLATIEDLFHLPRLGLAADPGVKTFGADVYGQAS